MNQYSKTFEKRGRIIWRILDRIERTQFLIGAVSLIVFVFFAGYYETYHGGVNSSLVNYSFGIFVSNLFVWYSLMPFNVHYYCKYSGNCV